MRSNASTSRAFVSASWLCALLLAFPSRIAIGTESTPLVAAASSLRFALQKVAEQFTRDTGKRVKLIFGSSGNFRRQIAQGAPFQIFLSANEDYIFALADQQHTLDDGALFAEGRLVLFVPRHSPLTADGTLGDLTRAIGDGRLNRFAIANPEHAPYGQRAKEALEFVGIWDALQGKLVIGENASQAAQFSLSGGTQGGIIAYSLALAPKLGGRGQYALIPNNFHKPLQQRMALLKGAGETAREFYRYLQNESVHKILQGFGFAPPASQQSTANL